VTRVALAAALTILASPVAHAQSPTDPATLAAADSFVVRFETTRGAVDLMVRRHWAPLGAVQLGRAVAEGYYDGAAFFRALRGFVVQWGIAADPAKTATWRDRRIADDPTSESNRRGTVTFASGGPNTRTVQLFVNLRDNARLDAMGFPPIGEVIRGMEVVDALHTGYGEGAPAGRGPSQDRLTAEGEPYLAREFPQLDRIRTARIVQVFGGR
jgi:peptidyl-prolyl cis-trans isomerase A (cyclophilin A)